MAGGPPGATTAVYSVSDAFNYGWKKFQENWVPWVLAVIAMAAISLLVQVINGVLWSPLAPKVDVTFDAVTGQVQTSTGGLGGGFFGSLLYATLSYFIPAIVGWILSAQIIRGALATVENGKIDFSIFTKTTMLGTVLVASLLSAVFTSLGILACFVGAIVVSFFIQYFAYFVLDKGEQPMESIKSSFSFVNQHLANIFVLFLGSVVALIIGALLCGVGLLVAVPVVAIAQAYTYRVLRGEPVAA